MGMKMLCDVRLILILILILILKLSNVPLPMLRTATVRR